MLARIGNVLSQTLRFLTFRSFAIDPPAQKRDFIIAGLLFAWIAGLGRYWDHPSAQWWQYWGLGSVAYIFALSAFIWALVKPIGPARWSYSMVFIFVALTSPLAWLYAVPVERFTSVETAISLNVWFLGIVALWRVALYHTFLRKAARLGGGVAFLMFLLPLVLIMASLSALNLEQGVFEIMAGIERTRTDSEQIRDAIYARISILGALSFLLAPFLAGGYLLVVIQRYYDRRTERKNAEKNADRNE